MPLQNRENVDLVQEFGSDQGFWKTFADGVEEIETTCKDYLQVRQEGSRGAEHIATDEADLQDIEALQQSMTRKPE